MMQRSKLLAISFYLGAVLVGGVLGITADRMLVRGYLDGRSGDARASRDRFAAELRLTPEQQGAADTIFGEARRSDSTLMAPIRALMAPLRNEQDSIWSSANARFRERLNADQQVTFDERLARRQRSGSGRR